VDAALLAGFGVSTSRGLGRRLSATSRTFHRRAVAACAAFRDGVGVDLVALHDVVVGDRLTGVGVDLVIFDAVAGLPVELVEGDLFRFRGGRIKLYGTGDERKAQDAFQREASSQNPRWPQRPLSTP